MRIALRTGRRRCPSGSATWTCWTRGHLEQGICDFGHSRVVLLLARDSIVAETGEKAFREEVSGTRPVLETQQWRPGVVVPVVQQFVGQRKIQA
jgi:hypothetical protein